MTAITHYLYQWYESHKRELPWRETHDPYAIWLSEIILQQTRVDQGLAYFERFMSLWPDIQSLASANEQEVLKAWQGLGYYSRARNLLAAARDICDNYKGVFPEDFTQLKALKGIGPYTAAAVGSIAFNLPYAVVDGNVMRVIARLFGIKEAVDSNLGKKKIQDMANMLLNQQHPGMHNQAMMEFGALQCVPVKPLCSSCILQQFCIAFKDNMVSELPRKSKKITPKTRWFNYLICTSEDMLLLQKRTSNDIWKGLYEFPLIETFHDASTEEILLHPDLPAIMNEIPFVIKKISGLVKHQLTHQRIIARFFHLRFQQSLVATNKNTLSLINESQLPDFPLPRLIDRYLQEVGLDGTKY